MTATAELSVRQCRGVPLAIPRVYSSRPEWPAVTCDREIPPPAAEAWAQPGGMGATVCESCAAEIQRRVAVQDAEAEAADLRERLSRAGLYAPFVNGTKSLETWQHLTAEYPKALEALRQRIKSLDGQANDASLNVMIVGSTPGNGKTHALCGAVREAILCGHRAMYVNCRDLAIRLQASFRDEAKETQAEIISRVTAPGVLLALDDLGATKTTRLIADSFYAIFERRAQNELPTICASNYERHRDLAERLRPADGDDLDGMRPVDRLRELCPKTFTLRGESQRASVNR